MSSPTEAPAARTVDPITKLAIETIKMLSIDGVQKANSGHPGTPMGLAEIAHSIFAVHMRHDPSDPGWIGRDRFVLSCGHASMLLYSMLHLSGYGLPLEQLQQFRQWDSKTPGHPEVHHTVGVETTTGPLGQGVGNAVGFALAMRMMEARFGEPFAGQHVFCICSDGDLMEGISGEASSIAGHLGLSNVIVMYDDNKITIEGETELAFSEDVGGRYEAYGWFVQRIDGHNLTEIDHAIKKAKLMKDRPSFIVCRTHIANGAPDAHDTAGAHGAPLGDEEIAKVKTLAGWDASKKFFVPEEVRAFWKKRGDELKAEHAAWNDRYQAWRGKNAELAKNLDAFLSKETPKDLLAQLIKAIPEKDAATRDSSNAIQCAAAKLVPQLVGGSADLAPSTKTFMKGEGNVARGEFAGRNLHFGIREHGMGAVCNALGLFGGLIPYGSTFLIFSDYMRPSIRLSCIMHTQVIWVYTHDSIFVGEDGPTHQPIEQLGALRLIPGLHVVRPADSMEVAAAWTMAIERKDGPTLFSLTRQKLPNLERDAGFSIQSLMRGAYVLADCAGKPDAVIIATGSEVQLAVGAKERLEKNGKKVRVVSAPCLEVFAEQSPEYQESVLPKGVRRVSIEAGRTPPWRAIVGLEGLALGIDHYGASAPDKVLAEKFGFSVDSVTKSIEGWI